jgi:hypothetical protein
MNTNSNLNNNIKDELIKEKQLLRKIRKQTKDIIVIIYSYLNGKPKYIYFNKYKYLEKNIKNDYFNGYPIWKFIHQIIDPLTKEQLMEFIVNGPVKNYPQIIEKIWYFSKDTCNFYDGRQLIDLWTNQIQAPKFQLEYMDSVVFTIKTRLIDAIYHYILRNIEKYEREKYIQLNFTNANINFKKRLYSNKYFKEIEKTLYLFKSLEYINKIYGSKLSSIQSSSKSSSSTLI